MERSRGLASAPVTWGVWERTTGRDDLVPAALLLETVRELGYTGIELGPPGLLRAAGARRVRAASSSAVSRRSTSTTRRRSARTSTTWLDPIAAALADDRQARAGRARRRGDARAARGRGPPDEQARTALRGDRLARALERVAQAAERCRARGVDAVFHHHAATYVETPGGDRGARRADGRGALLRHRARGSSAAAIRSSSRARTRAGSGTCT